MNHSINKKIKCKNSTVLLKKKENQFENETNEKIPAEPEYIPSSYGDRFIPRRFSLKNCDRNLKFGPEKLEKDVLLQSSKKDYWREDTYVPTINYIMEMKQDRILDLTDPVVKSAGPVQKTHGHSIKSNNWFLNDWPCKPRSKPSASLDSILELPEHDANCDQNRVDWSVKGHIAVSFGQDIIIWKSKENVKMAFNTKCTRSLAYSPNGNFLAIGCKSCDYPVLELWDVSRSQDFCVINGKVFSLKHVAVQCIQWTSSGKQIVCGTHYGCVYVLSVPDMDIIKKIRKHHLPITHIRISPTMNYLASADSEGNIFIYNWNKFNVYLRVKSKRKLNVVFDWHPWTGVDLAISEDFPASIVILNVPSKKMSAYYQQIQSKIAINYISFSKLTGELLVSISNKELHLCRDYKVLVMSSLDRIVDVLKLPDGEAKFLMWNPDGTTVATTSSDADLSLWHFCLKKKSKALKNNVESKDKLPLESEFGNEFQKLSFLR